MGRCDRFQMMEDAGGSNSNRFLEPGYRWVDMHAEKKTPKNLAPPKLQVCPTTPMTPILNEICPRRIKFGSLKDWIPRRKNYRIIQQALIFIKLSNFGNWPF